MADPGAVPSLMDEGVDGFVFDSTRGRNVAVKRISKIDYLENKVRMDRAICNAWRVSFFSHRNVVQLREVFMTPHQIGMVTEILPGGVTLTSVLAEVANGERTPISYNGARSMFQQMVLAVEFFHRLERKILLQLGGFGSSKSMEQGRPRTRAAEATTADVYNGQAVDVWSLGVVLFEMQYGGHPLLPPSVALDPEGDRRVVLRHLILNAVNGNIQFPVGAAEAQSNLNSLLQGFPVGAAEAQPNLVSLLRGMLNHDPTLRLTIAEVMEHPWFLRCMAPGTLGMNKRMIQAGMDLDIDLDQRNLSIMTPKQALQNLHDLLSAEQDGEFVSFLLNEATEWRLTLQTINDFIFVLR
eukprot:gene32225-16786_t